MPNPSSTMESRATNPIAEQDPQVWCIINAEKRRQQQTLEMIASENHASAAVMAATGSCLTNKYSEGYPGKRYYSGCQYYDEVETLAIDRAKQLFGCSHANVQPHSGANANLAACFALLEAGDSFMSIVLSDGGHLTHGSPVNLSGKWLKPIHYPLVYAPSRPDYGHIDYEAVSELAQRHRPKLIMCGYSAYPRLIDFARFRQIADDCGAMLMADIAHIAGLVAGGAHPPAFPHAHVVTTTTHKTLRGPRGGLVLTDDPKLADRIDKAVFPGIQGGPLMHVIAAKAICFGEALRPEFKQYTHQVVANAAALAKALDTLGQHLCAGGTDNHLMLVDLRPLDPNLTGKQAAAWLEEGGIIANKNTVPGEQRSPFATSGVRLGTAALTTRGMGNDQMNQIASLIDQVLRSGGDGLLLRQVHEQVQQMCNQFPMSH